MLQKEITVIKGYVIKDYQRIVRSLADSGRSMYYKYLIIPLSAWAKVVPEKDLDSILATIKDCLTKGEFERVPGLYKSAIAKAAAPDQMDLSVPGNICLDYLNDMDENTSVASSPISVDFVNILRKPFNEFTEYEFRSAKTKFKEKVEDADEDEARQMVLSTKVDDEVLLKAREISRKEAAEIESSLPDKNVSDIKKTVASFLLKYSNSSDPGMHMEIDALLDKIEKMNKGFKKDCYDAVAVIIYKELMKSIKNNEFKKAVRLISKFAVLFRGNPSTPYFIEFDEMEKSFFNNIEKRELWGSI